VVGSAAFFAIYHPPMSWLPVFAVGLVNAWLFKTSGRLLPCVILHMAYNAMIIFIQ
jgi:membrane protease YdiL (CAAX protease family)